MMALPPWLLAALGSGGGAGATGGLGQGAGVLASSAGPGAGYWEQIAGGASAHPPLESAVGGGAGFFGQLGAMGSQGGMGGGGMAALGGLGKSLSAKAKEVRPMMPAPRPGGRPTAFAAALPGGMPVVDRMAIRRAMYGLTPSLWGQRAPAPTFADYGGLG